MSQYENHFNYKCQPMICGNSIDVCLDKCSTTQIRADIIVEEYDHVNLWGQIKSCKGHLISGALVKLVQVVCSCDNEELCGIAHTISDCKGFYQFELKKSDKCAKYRVIVGRAEGYDELEECTTQPCCLVEECKDCHRSCPKECCCVNPAAHACRCEEHPHCNKCDTICDTICKNINCHAVYDYSCKPSRRC